MTDDYRKIRKKIFSSEFNNFFNKKLSLYLGKIEKLRKQYLYSGCILGIIALIPSGFLLFIFFLNTSGDSSFIENRNLIDFLLFVEVILIGLIFYTVKTYKNKVKAIILPRLLSFAGDFRIIEKGSPEYDIRNYVSSLGLFSSFNRYSCDDRFEGMYKNIKVSISEIALTKETGSGKNRRNVIIFNCLLVKVPSLKKYKGATYIKRNSTTLGFNRKKVNLEDPEFEKYYDVYSTDQVEARYLITTAFMNRMVELAKKGIGENITLSFEHGNVNIAVSSSKDWFEVPILKPANDVNVYRAILVEIITILSIIDSLRLDMKIGL